MSSCALCQSTESLSSFVVTPRSDEVLLCGVCLPQVEGSELDPNHWYCLQESAWSEEAAVQVVAWRLLQRLKDHGWASNLLDMLYLDEELLEWAESGLQQEDVVVVKDCNGVPLVDGDSVTIIKDLPVKGAGFTAKRGTLVKNIRLGDDPTHVEGKVNKVSILLKTIFLKKTN